MVIKDIQWKGLSGHYHLQFDVEPWSANTMVSTMLIGAVCGTAVFLCDTSLRTGKKEDRKEKKEGGVDSCKPATTDNR